LATQTFVVKTQAELAQFLSALHEAINAEWQSRLNAFIPDQAPEPVERDNIAGC
jgi:malate synthase